MGARAQARRQNLASSVVARQVQELLTYCGEKKSVLFLCAHGAHRGIGTCLLFMCAMGCDVHEAADHIESVRYVADLSSTTDRHPVAQRVLVKTLIDSIGDIAGSEPACLRGKLKTGSRDDIAAAVLAMKVNLQQQRRGGDDSAEAGATASGISQHASEASAQEPPRGADGSAEVRAEEQTSSRGTESAKEEATLSTSETVAPEPPREETSCAFLVDLTDDTALSPHEVNISDDDEEENEVVDADAGTGDAADDEVESARVRERLAAEWHRMRLRTQVLRLEEEKSDLERQLHKLEADMDGVEADIVGLLDQRAALEGRRRPDIAEVCECIRQKQWEDSP